MLNKKVPHEIEIILIIIFIIASSLSSSILGQGASYLGIFFAVLAVIFLVNNKKTRKDWRFIEIVLLIIASILTVGYAALFISNLKNM